MFPRGQCNHQPTASSILILTFILLLFALFISCNNLNKHNDDYYDAFFLKQHKRFADGQMNGSIKSVDSFYLANGAPSVGYLRYKWANFKSGYYYFREKLDLAAIYVDSSILALEGGNITLKYAGLYADALNARGDYYYNTGEIDKAFGYYSRSRAVSLTLQNNKCAIGNQAYHLGMITFRQERYGESVAYFKQSIDGVSNCGCDSVTYYWLQEIFGNTALAYTRLGLNDSAKLYYQRALIFLDSEAPKFSFSGRQRKMAEIARGVTMGNLAKVYIAQNERDTAEQLLQKSIAINIRPGYQNFDAMFTQMQLAELYYDEKRLPEVKKNLVGLRFALDTVANTSVELRWQKLMYTYYLDMKQPALASGYMAAFISLKDSLDNATKNLKKTDYGQLLKEQETQYQIRLLQKDNQLKQWYLFVSIALAVMAFVIIVLVYVNYRKSRKNVNELTRLNGRINEQKDELVQSNQDKDRILHVVAHDLRSPISSIMMLSEIMKSESQDSANAESLNMIMSVSQSLLSLTTELLEFSGENNHIAQLPFEIADVTELAKLTTGILQFKAGEKNQKVNLSLPQDQPLINCNKDKIIRVFNNLITNAIKFSPENATIDVSLTINGKNVLIVVKDNGIGIPAKLLPRVFESFTSAKRYGTAGERSFGLGLSICKQIVDAHNGRIWVESAEGQGSAFFVELPLASDKK